MELKDLIALNGKIEEAPRPATFLRERFFGGRTRMVADYNYGYDVVSGKKLLAPFVHPSIGARKVDRTGYDTRLFKFPLIAPMDVLTEEDFANRLPGEPIGGNMTMTERQERDQMLRYAQFDAYITRREEAMIAELLTDGKMTIKGEGVDTVIDYAAQFGWAGASDITDGTQDWDATTSKKLANLRAWKLAIYLACGIHPDTVIFGSDASAAFLDDAAVQATLDRMRFNVGQVQYSDISGAESFGNLFGMDLFGYSDGYVTEAGATVDFIDSQSVLIGCSAARVPEQEIAYGPYHDTVTNQDFLQSRLVIPGDGDRLQNVTAWKMVSRPLPHLPFVKSWKCIRVID